MDLLAQDQPRALVLPTTIRSRDLVWILRTGTGRRWHTMQSQFGDSAWDTAIELVRSGVGVVRCTVDGFDYRPHSFRLTEAWAAVAEDHITELTGRADPDTARSELLDCLRTVPELADEHALLAAMPATGPLRVPPASQAATAAWSVYDCAVRAACVWLPDHAAGITHTSKALAGFAFHNTKRWTPERETAFANLIRMPFHTAVKDADVAVLMRGPLQWRVGTVVADASASRPWIGLPAEGMRLLGTLDTSGIHGVLFVENKDTFQQVCGHTDIVERWLCVWGQGYPSNGLVALLTRLDGVPLAAWCDLDADGIGIVANLAERVGRHVNPIGMDVGFWAAGPHREQTPDAMALGRALAAKMADHGPAQLRLLAASIAENGEGREQETLHHEVLPGLGACLRELETASTAGVNRQ
ncbi:Wadjet anti-phage system protein JetD domain-containing protein [Nocardia sp. XZ_19_231]|uniref:Wadjet anti-phage system protein JetD domain-containing protein n=1 Tax=Nocardia sp. XZ_19_231 TaxID=2769252 RepID=UPI00188E99D5